VSVLAVACAVLRRIPSAGPVTLALLLTVLAAETTLHSVHHLTDPAGASRCQGLALSQNLAGDLTAAPPALPAAVVSHRLVVPDAAPGPSASVHRPDQGRAPPALPA
jgi:hypothetical protein